MSEELKPCPFCGSADVHFVEAFDDEGLMRVLCEGCGFTTGMESTYEAGTAFWNGLGEKVAAQLAAAEAERDALAEKWQSVPWKLLKSVRDSVYDYSVRLERAAEDNEDRSYAWDKRIDALTMDQFIDEYAPQEPPHADR